MIYKTLTFQPFDIRGNQVIEVLEPGESLIKTAAARNSPLPPELDDFISSIKSQKGKSFVLVSALSGMEAYGSNFNADSFPIKALSYEPPGWDKVKHDAEARVKFADNYCRQGGAYGYTTFYAAHNFAHHRNFDPYVQTNRNPFLPLGRIIFAVMNNYMQRVELVLEVDHALCKKNSAPGLVERLLNGEHPPVSMGTKVPFDICSECSNVAKTRAQYCIHLRTMKNQIMPNGTQVTAINTRPRFFDISWVDVGASPTSITMEKVAYPTPYFFYNFDKEFEAYDTEKTASFVPGLVSGTLRVVNNVDKGLDERGLEGFDEAMSRRLKMVRKFREMRKLSSLKKKAIIEKPDPTKSESQSIEQVSTMSQSEKSLPKSVLDTMSGHPLPESLGTAGTMGIVLKPHEFQRMILKSIGEASMADRLDNENKVFPRVRNSLPMSMGPQLHLGLRGLLAPFMKERSGLSPLVNKRMTIVIRVTPKRIMEDTPLLNKVSALYNGYRQELASGYLEKSAHLREHDSVINKELLDGVANLFVPDMEKVAGVDDLERLYIEYA